MQKIKFQSRMFELLANFATMSYLIPVIAFSLFTNKEAKDISYFILILSLFGFFSNVLAYFFQEITSNCNPIYHYYTILDTSVLCWFYAKHFKNNSAKIIIGTLLFSFLVLSVYQLKTDYWGENSFAWIISKFLLIGLSLIGLINPMVQFVNDTTLDVDFERMSIAVLIFNSCTLFVALFEPFLREKDGFLLEIGWTINLILILIYNSLLTIILWKMKR